MRFVNDSLFKKDINKQKLIINRKIVLDFWKNLIKIDISQPREEEVY